MAYLDKRWRGLIRRRRSLPKIASASVCPPQYNGNSRYPDPSPCTLGPAYNEEKDAKETALYKWVLVVTKLFNMAVNDFDAKESARYSWVLAVTELVLSGTQCM